MDRIDEKEKKWWHPTVTDTEYCNRLRDDYPENAHMDDDELRDFYADGRKYSTLWDHIGDAYEDYEPLADSYFDLLTALAEKDDEINHHLLVLGESAKSEAEKDKRIEELTAERDVARGEVLSCMDRNDWKDRATELRAEVGRLTIALATLGKEGS